MVHNLLATRRPPLIQDRYWAALSSSLVEFSFTMDDEYEPIYMAQLNRLTNLTSLKVCNRPRGRGNPEVPRSYVLNLPELRNLHLTNLKVNHLELQYTRLRKLTLDYCRSEGRLWLHVPLQELFFRGTYSPDAVKGFLLSEFYSLTRLYYDTRCEMSLSALYSILPFLSGLRTLGLNLEHQCHDLPEHLPANLQSLRCLVHGTWASNVLEPFTNTWESRGRQSSKLQSIVFAKRDTWGSWESYRLWKVRRDTKAQVILRENMEGDDFSLMDEAIQSKDIILKADCY